MYRIFTSLFVDKFSFSFFFSLFLFPYAASRVEKRDGPILLFYRIILLSILTNAFFALISWPILSWNYLLGFSLKMSGMNNLWLSFLLVDTLQDPMSSSSSSFIFRFRQTLASNRMMLVLAILFAITLLFSVSSIPIAIVAVLCRRSFQFQS